MYNLDACFYDDQLVSITKKDETTPFATYKYDDDGRRIEKTVNGQITRYHYDGDSINVLYETDAGGNVLRQYVYSVDGVRLAMKSQGQILTYHYNPHGDVIGISDQDGQTLAQYVYDAWGNIIQQNEQGLSVDNPFKYAGYMHDEEINLYYLMARYYHPTHGVFISVDPDPGDADDPITQNGYTYANNNPVMMVDPDGHYFWFAVNAGFAAYDGYKAYKSGAGWKGVAKASAKSLVGVGKYKLVKKSTQVVKKTGVVYQRTNVKTGKKYIGQAISEQRYKKRQGEHSRNNKKARYEFEIIGRAAPGKELDVLEQRMINKHGGVGKLENKRNQISPKKWNKYKTK